VPALFFGDSQDHPRDVDAVAVEGLILRTISRGVGRADHRVIIWCCSRFSANGKHAPSSRGCFGPVMIAWFRLDRRLRRSASSPPANPQAFARRPMRRTFVVGTQNRFLFHVPRRIVLRSPARRRCTPTWSISVGGPSPGPGYLPCCRPWDSHYLVHVALCARRRVQPLAPRSFLLTPHLGAAALVPNVAPPQRFTHLSRSRGLFVASAAAHWAICQIAQRTPRSSTMGQSYCRGSTSTPALVSCGVRRPHSRRWPMRTSASHGPITSPRCCSSTTARKSEQHPRWRI